MQTEILKQLISKANVDEGTAKTVLNVVADYLSKQLPEPAGSLAANALRSDGVASSLADAAKGSLSSLFNS